MTAIEATPLPQLRSELRLLDGEPYQNGQPSWLIFDPVKHRYFRIGEMAVRMLRHWSVKQPESLLRRVNAEAEEKITADQVEDLRRFVTQNQLTVLPAQEDYSQLARHEEAANPALWQQVVHKIVFTRIPLFQPDGFLKATYPFVAGLFTRTAWVLIGLAAMFGLYLVSRQWEAFVSTFLYFLSPQGALFYVLSLIVLMSLHELGHGYAARRYGVRVSTIGIAFIVFFPILYTDTTDAWRLTDKRKRLVIDLAGVAVELIIATVATLLWVLLPDGIFRSVAFFAATTSWLLSLFINLNPFMRFDGYYVLSDILGTANLHPRSFEFGKWRIREILFDLKAPAPEPLLPRQALTMTVFAWLTWIYRFFLFLGIALMVHALFSKAIGIILFVIEIFFFIAQPILKEIKRWHAMRETILISRRWKLTASAVIVFAAILLLPWRTTVHMPALVQPSQVSHVYAPSEGQLISILVKEGDWIEQGTPLFKLNFPRIDHDLKMTEAEISVIRDRLDRRVEDHIDRSQTRVLLQTLVALEAEYEGLLGLKSGAEIKAPHAGFIRDIPRDVGNSQWIDTSIRLASLVSDRQVEFKALIPETDRHRLKLGAQARFIADDSQLPNAVGTAEYVSAAALAALEDPVFAQSYGGRVAVREADKGQLIPTTALFEVQGTLNAPYPLARKVPGVLILKVKNESPASAIWRRVAGVLLRETDF